MKFFRILVPVFALLLMFFACKKDVEKQDDNDTTNEGFVPSILLLDNNSIVNDTTVFVSDTLKFTVQAFSNDVSQSNLNKFQVLKKEGANFQLFFDTLINSATFGPYNFLTKASAQAISEVYAFNIIDKQNNSHIIYLTVQVKNPIDTITKSKPGPNGTFAFGGFPEPEVLPLSHGIWMAGDLHVHTNYSTDASNRPMSEVISTAKSNGLTFLGVTDHDNHVNGDVAGNTWADPAYKNDDELLVLYGAEWTSAKGHGNTFSPKPYEHMKMYKVRDSSISALQETVYDLDLLLSANHPSGGDPWGYGYDVVRSIEVWNSAIWLTNTDAQTIWNDQLNTGRRMTGIGGSDSHHGYATSFEDLFNPNSYQALANALGTPTTWVRAKDFSSEAVVDAIAAGRVSISATPNAPRLVLEASDRSDGVNNYGIGDNITLSENKNLNFTVKLENVSVQLFFYRLTILKNGSELSTEIIYPGQREITFEDTPNVSGRSYYRVILEGISQSQINSPASVALSLPMVAMSNPVYVNF